MSVETEQIDLSGESVEHDSPIADLVEDGDFDHWPTDKKREKACPLCQNRVTINTDWTGAAGHQKDCPYWGVGL